MGMLQVRRITLWPTAILAATVVLCFFGAVGLHALAQAPASLAGQVVIPDGVKPAPNFVLQDQNGQSLSMKDLRGRVVVMTFLDSHCTQDCPIIGRELALVQQRLGPSVPWTLLVVSVAPLTDSPASSATFALKSKWRMDWRWLFGTPGQLATVWRDYGIWVQPTPKDIMHTAAIFLVGPDGAIRVTDMLPIAPDQLVQSIKALTPQPRNGWFSWLPRF